MRRSITPALVGIWLIQHCAFAAQQDELLRRGQAQLRWSEPPPVLVDRHVAVRPDGVCVEGDVLAMREDALVLDIVKTSERKLHPKGQASVPRAGIMEIRVIRIQDPGRLAGGLAGAVGGFFVAASALYCESAVAAVAGFFVGLPVMAVAGYYARKAADRRSTVITITPEAAAGRAQEEQP